VEDVGDVDVILVPCGGGALLAGVAAAVKLSGLAHCRVYGVEPQTGELHQSPLTSSSSTVITRKPIRTETDVLLLHVQSCGTVFQLILRQTDINFERFKRLLTRHFCSGF